MSKKGWFKGDYEYLRGTRSGNSVWRLDPWIGVLLGEDECVSS